MCTQEALRILIHCFVAMILPSVTEILHSSSQLWALIFVQKLVAF